MPAPNLKNMDVDALLALRSQIDGQLATRRSDLQKQLARLQRASTDAPGAVGNGRTSALKGGKGKPNKAGREKEGGSAEKVSCSGRRFGVRERGGCRRRASRRCAAQLGLWFHHAAAELAACAGGRPGSGRGARQHHAAFAAGIQA